MARKPVSKSKNEPIISQDRKLEILGVILIALSLLVGLSVFTYNSVDDELIRSHNFVDLVTPGSIYGSQVNNALGPVGAYLSHFLVYTLFGYFTIVLAGLGLTYGWYIFRHKEMDAIHRRSLYYTILMILLATIFGWLYQMFDYPSMAFSGSVGIAISMFLLSFTAVWGSAIILFFSLIVALLFVVDGDIQKTIDRIKELSSKVKEQAAAKNEERKREAEQKKILKAEDQKKKVIEPEPEPEETKEQRRIRLRREEEEELLKRPQRAVIEEESIEEKKVENLEKSGESEPDFNVFKGEEEEEADAGELDAARNTGTKKVIKYMFPGINLLDSPPNEGNEVDMDEIQQNKDIILDKLKRHNIEILDIEAVVGPTVTLYELEPAPDVKISKIESYANDLKMAMATHGLRIIAPIPGKSAVGIEVPNRKRETVYIKQVINTKKFVDSKMVLPVAFGKTIENEVFMVDLTKLPHLLMAGATGSGKSVGINTVITCLLYKCHPDDLKFVLVDPKKIELALYRNIQNHFLATLPDMEEPIITDTSRVLEALNSVCKEMDERYDLLKMAMVREIISYNEKFDKGELEKELGHRHLPYIVVVIDELADLMITAGKGIEEPIARIAQLARAVGIHLVIATQRPSVNVITGTIKANFPARIAYRVASKVDSRTILDTIGADQLVGRGDMLFTGGSGMIRVQNAFVSTEEVERINTFIGNQMGYKTPFYLPKIEDENAASAGIFDKSDRDDLFVEAAKVVVLHQQGSVSLLQRKLKLGYNRAGRIIDQLFAAGVVGPYQGSTARDVLIADEDELENHLRDLDDE